MKCKKCGSEEIELLEGFKGKVNIWIKIGIFIAMIAFGINNLGPLAVISLFAFVGVIIYEKRRMKKSYTKMVCKNCAHIEWLK